MRSLSISLLCLARRSRSSLPSPASRDHLFNPPYRSPCSRSHSTAAPRAPPERVVAIADEIAGLTLLEVADLSEILRTRLGIAEMPAMALMTPGMDPAAVGGAAGAAPAAEEKKEEKTAFDLKLESFEAAAKIKIIKEVRSFTDLGLKEAKELVEKAPAVLKQGVLKEEAEKIVEKMKELGAKVVLE